MATIEFTLRPDIPANVSGEVPKPRPAGSAIGDWYQKLNLHAQDSEVVPKLKHFDRLTAKSCGPFVDAMCTGYFIPALCDIEVEVGPVHGVDDGSFRLGSRYYHIDPCGMHERWQLPDHPLLSAWDCKVVGKFSNPWIIKTPPGYACLFLSPLINDPEQNFYTFGGLVSTDTYPLPVDLPFVVNCKKLKGQFFTIKKGEPLVVVIPLRMDNWVSKIYTEKAGVDAMVEAGKARLCSLVQGAYKKYWRKVSTYRVW
jgi:hypothetical protein